MLVEAVVFCRNQSFFDERRDFINRDEVAAFFAELGNEFAVRGPHTHRNLRLVVDDSVNRRELRVNEGEDKKR